MGGLADAANTPPLLRAGQTDRQITDTDINNDETSCDARGVSHTHTPKRAQTQVTPPTSARAGGAIAYRTAHVVTRAIAYRTHDRTAHVATMAATSLIYAEPSERMRSAQYTYTGCGRVVMADWPMAAHSRGLHESQFLVEPHTKAGSCVLSPALVCVASEAGGAARPSPCSVELCASLSDSLACRSFSCSDDGLRLASSICRRAASAAARSVAACAAVSAASAASVAAAAASVAADAPRLWTKRSTGGEGSARVRRGERVGVRGSEGEDEAAGEGERTYARAAAAVALAVERADTGEAVT